MFSKRLGYSPHGGDPLTNHGLDTRLHLKRIVSPFDPQSKIAEGEPLPTSLRYRGECLVQTGHNRCVVSVFDYRVARGETVRWQEEEVDWGSYLPWGEVRSTSCRL